MKRADIALTVGGILATMAFAWLLYRLQQSKTTAPTATPDVASDVTSGDYYSSPSIVLSGGGVTSQTGTQIASGDSSTDTSSPSFDNGAALLQQIIEDFPLPHIGSAPLTTTSVTSSTTPTSATTTITNGSQNVNTTPPQTIAYVPLSNVTAVSLTNDHLEATGVQN